MGTLTLGDTQIAIGTPDDMAARTLALTGLSPAELAGYIGQPSPSLLAAAIAAVATGSGTPCRADLGALVEAGDPLAIAQAVIPCLVPPPGEPEAPGTEAATDAG